MRLECSIQLHQNPNMEISLLLAGAWFKAQVYTWIPTGASFIKEMAKNGSSPKWVETVGKDEAGGKSLVLFFWVMIPKPQNKLFFSAEPNGRVVSDDDDEDRVGSRMFFEDWRGMEQNHQIEVNDNTRANSERWDVNSSRYIHYTLWTLAGSQTVTWTWVRMWKLHLPKSI